MPETTVLWWLTSVLNKLKILSYNNDLNNYYRVVSRTYKINLCSWNILDNYNIERNSKYKSEYVLNLNINDMKPYSDELYNDYLEFHEQKNDIIETIKTTNKQITDKIEAMQIASIKKILNNNKQSINVVLFFMKIPQQNIDIIFYI